MNLLNLRAIIRVSRGILSNQPLCLLQRSGRTCDGVGRGESLVAHNKVLYT